MQKILELRAFAEANQISYDRMIRIAKMIDPAPGEIDGHSCLEKPWGVCFSIEEHNPGLFYRHASMTRIDMHSFVLDDECEVVLKQLGFVGGLPVHVWKEKLSPISKKVCLNFMQKKIDDQSLNENPLLFILSDHVVYREPQSTENVK